MFGGCPSTGGAPLLLGSCAGFLGAGVVVVGVVFFGGGGGGLACAFASA